MANKPVIFKVTNFQLDQSLMYLIQQTTKHPTTEIMGYFYNLAVHIAEIAHSKQPDKRYIMKVLDWHYEGTNIPYRLDVFGGSQLEEDGLRHIRIKVKPLVKNSFYEVTDIMNSIVENGLGLDGCAPLPEFKKPPTRVPAGFKKFLHE